MIRSPRTLRRLLLVLLLATLPLAGCRADKGGTEEDASGKAGVPAADVRLLFTYGSEKEAWIEEVTAAFNREAHRTASGKTVAVEAFAQGSGEMIDDILSGVRKPDLVSPASEAFLRLGNAQSRAKTGKNLVGETRSLILSPVVIALWRPMAEALGWGREPIGWSNVLQLAQNPAGWSALGHPEWGRFRFGHTHPDYSNSGLISLLAETYAATGKSNALTLADVARPETARFVAGIESAVVHCGSSTGFFGKRMVSGGPGYLSAAVLYENMVIEANSARPAPRFPLVALYPKEGTIWSDHPVGLVEREWLTPERREAAQVYMDYLLARPQQERALHFGFRPSAVDVPLGAPIDAAHGVDPKEPQTTLEVPPVEVIDAVRTLFRQAKKRSDVLLVLDVSGSMDDERKLENAQAGAQQLLDLLDPEDTFSLLTFNAEASWASRDVALKSGRETVRRILQGLFAAGGTALYDAVAEGYEHQRENAETQRAQERGTISAIVVLSDGDDTDSAVKLDELLSRVRSRGEEGGIRIFTIGYGKGAKREVLEAIAEAAQGKFYPGNPGNIRTVFREISTFF